MESAIKYLSQITIVWGVFLIILALWAIMLIKKNGKSPGTIKTLYAGIAMIFVTVVLGYVMYRGYI